jgi:hypothetical protein
LDRPYRGDHPPPDVRLVSVRDHPALITYSRAKKQSLEFAKKITPLLAKDQPAEAVEVSRKFKASHLARVTRAGLIEFLYDQTTNPNPVAGHDVIEAARRAIERESLVVYSDLQEGRRRSRHHRHHRPLHRPVRHGDRHHPRLPGHGAVGSGGIGSVSKGISEALVTTALGLGVAIPAAWLFNYFTNVLERFQVEMSNSASELLDFFIKKQGAKQGANAVAIRA